MDLVVCVASLASYRSEVVSCLLEQTRESSCSLTVFAGSPAYDPSIILADYEDLGIRKVQNIYLPKNILIQVLPLRECLKADSILLDLNPRVASTWLLLVARGLRRKRTVLWGHAFSKGKRGGLGSKLRDFQVSLASSVVLYTETQKRQLQPGHPQADIFVAPNALYRRDAMTFASSDRRDSFVIVGRLVDGKNPGLAIRAFELVEGDMPEARLVFVGAGPLSETLKSMVPAHLTSRIEFLGHVDDPDRLRNIYSQAVACLNPGYLGLSATQSLGFGVPLIVADGIAHSPEIEAVRLGWNGASFPAASSEGLAEQMTKFWRQRGSWAERGEAIADECRSNYSAEAMANGLMAALIGPAK